MTDCTCSHHASVQTLEKELEEARRLLAEWSGANRYDTTYNIEARREVTEAFLALRERGAGQT